ncbi:MAG: hypothetical protein KF753_12600 [Caldilineaceae bacterium]|nr:hypothetical protein [Caldilineaceae bacterium]
MYEENIRLSNLLLDSQNPRLPEEKPIQRDAIRAMAEGQKDKLVALAQHFVENGPNPANLPIVTPAKGDEGMFVVLDGNRRVAALKLLENPSIADDIFDRGSAQKLRDMAGKFSHAPIEELTCVVFPTRENADIWIELIHRGQNQGAGLVEWDGQVAARYDARKGSKPVSLQILDFVRENAELTDETRKKIEAGTFPITNLERLVNTPYVRKKLGIEKKEGELSTAFPAAEVLKGLTRVVEDIGTKRITVSDIKRQDQRIDYVNKVGQEDLPIPETINDSARPLEDVNDVTPTKHTLIQRSSRSKPTTRSKLVPANCSLRIDQHRINGVYRELRNLRVVEYPNACAVMLRVFLELSLDHYLEFEVKWSEQQIENSFLSQKLSGAANYMKGKSILSENQLSPVYKAISGQTLLVASVKTMHGYVHNRHFSPIASELLITWDDLQPFIEKLWSN